jgi:hypothetical protein
METRWAAVQGFGVRFELPLGSAVVDQIEFTWLAASLTGDGLLRTVERFGVEMKA